ncbi:DUF7221 family queuine tRNA-ribosyltransferase-like protein [Salinibaculum rarum]|uniref:deazapurine DNA modification protein DpdA family protein n=1 Tax=Salinibaculum rarum TaxID=3058903 RepID=UPI00265F993C|nr:hypothetical protein [Salinibaculum sp. KK48]
MSNSDFQFYWGAASGSAQKALRKLEEPSVMLNYATKNNYPWEGIDELFIDSGAYSFLMGKGEYATTDTDYLEYVETHNPRFFALRDYLCAPDVLEEHNATVETHQTKTTTRHCEMMDLIDDRGIATDAIPVSVVQGWQPHQYAEHVDDLRDHGLLTDRVGIGSVARKNQAETVRRVIHTVREALPSRCSIHAFGVKRSLLKFPDIVDVLASADSCAYEFDQYMNHTVHADVTTSKSWRDYAFFYLRMKRRVETLVTAANGAAEPSAIRDDSQEGLDAFL